MTQLVPLHFEKSDVRMIVRDGEPWWVLADVAAALALSNPSMLAGRLEPYQKADLSIADSSSGQMRRMLAVNEAGVYALTLNSRKPEAKAFARWLFTEVLPSIRRFGTYPPPAMAELPEPDWHEGADRSLPDRFREERLRWEKTSGVGLHEVPGFTKPVISAIERDLGGLRKGRRIEMLTLAGLDVLYILSGQRTVSPAEGRVLTYLRTSTDPRTLVLIAAAQQT